MFLEETDLNNKIYEELRDHIARDNDDIWTQALNAAEGEAIGYLSKYNTDILFSATGASRDQTLVMYTLDLACWHFISLSNAGMEVEMFLTRYEQAIKNYFMRIQAGKFVPKGWLLATDSHGNEQSFFSSMSSSPRRNSHY